jgi:hypothetical protein
MKRQRDTQGFPTEKQFEREPKSTNCAAPRISKHSGPIRAILHGSELCEAEGITGTGSSPVLALCRALVEAGHDPRRPLHAYRGAALALKVRSIGEGATLRVATHGVGFERISGCTEGPPVRQSAPAVVVQPGLRGRLRVAGEEQGA